MSQDDLVNVNKSASSHLDAEGNSIQDLYFRVVSPSDLDTSDKLKFFFNNFITSKILVFLWIWFGIQFGVAPLVGIPIGSDLWLRLFAASGSGTDMLGISLFTYMFSHEGLLHIVVNSIVLFSFGIAVERYFSPKGYLLFFVAAGLIAALGQLTVFTLFPPKTAPSYIVGASGVIAAIVGFFTIKQPHKEMYLFFFIPMKVWIGTSIFLFGSTAVVLIWGSGAGGFGHTAHIVGLVFGLITGYLKTSASQRPISISPELFKK